ncbi:hypothetical protein GOL30_01410 [Sinorhizobium medicae]|uniref:hypothetical protein n=1 Tax=Sinorhizobium medicae TaxID=110321 RepID=UPI0004140F83|nr:hypothetical protein [Sinorhizobium medicae]MBO1941292.1 hypothetical protein [Sinorhizobium medicae]MDX0428415.1 hypothetical protein [Sinorhizobium medicae]MDX0440686.1 hypothetical protein [Sinorhizobium medicae]MDX0462003.1 hypothetical protein [Sinorhizobium medicae]MDX0483389.1 hypothetical protein [Sinorhizobium medicae]
MVIPDPRALPHSSTLLWQTPGEFVGEHLATRRYRRNQRRTSFSIRRASVDILTPVNADRFLLPYRHTRKSAFGIFRCNSPSDGQHRMEEFTIRRHLEGATLEIVAELA